jgi:hypothetical protein
MYIFILKKTFFLGKIVTILNQQKELFWVDFIVKKFQKGLFL